MPRNTIYHNTITWAAESAGLPMYMIAAKKIDNDMVMRRLFAHVARLLPREERTRLYALLRYSHIDGMRRQVEMLNKIADGEMIWSEEWNTWIEKSEEGNEDSPWI